MEYGITLKIHRVRFYLGCFLIIMAATPAIIRYYMGLE